MTTQEELELVSAGLAVIKPIVASLIGGPAGAAIATGLTAIASVIDTIENAKSGALTQAEAMTAISQLNSSIASNNQTIDAEAAKKFP